MTGHEQPVPIFIFAAGWVAPKAALVGEIGDGFVADHQRQGRGALPPRRFYGRVGRGRREGGRDPGTIDKFIEIKVSYDHDNDFAKNACEPWAALALTADEKGGTEDPIENGETRGGCEGPRPHPLHRSPTDPEEVVEKIAFYVDLGFEDLVFHFPGEDQERLPLAQFAADVLPQLQRALGIGAVPPGWSSGTSPGSRPTCRSSKSPRTQPM